eukprot:6377137-Alexandrium_andersonii.AAC.1
MGKSAPKERLRAPLRRAPSCFVRSSGPMRRRLFEGGSGGAPMSPCVGDRSLPMARVAYRDAATEPA